MTRQERSGTPTFQERYAVLLDIGRVLTGTRRPDELYRSIYQQTTRVLEAAGFYISLYDQATDTATVVFYADRGEERRVEISYRGSESEPIRSARPTLTRITEEQKPILLLGADEATRASISAPMLRDGRVLGVISAQSYRADAYDADDLELLAAVADLAAVALENARYLEETERRRREAERLEEIARALTASLELTEVLQRIVAATVELAEADGANVWLRREHDRTSFEAASAVGVLGFPAGSLFSVPADFQERFLVRQESLTFENVPEHPQLPPEVRKEFPTASAIAVPLVFEGRVIGALSVGHRHHRAYRREDLRLLERLSVHAAIAVENARLHEQIRALSLTDPLTGLPNRRHLELSLQKEFAAACRGRDLTVVLFDLDHFKEYNDTAGHQAGDQVLRSFARILAAETRAMNLAARYGGDEFICILSGTDGEGGLSHAARVAQVVADHPDMEGIGVSAGIASYAPAMGSAEDLIRAADRDLYRRKGARGPREIPASG